jgi:Glycosyl transferases group 1
LLRWLRRSDALDFQVLVGTDGPLVQRFADLAPVTTVVETGPDLLARADLVYANSTASHRILDALGPFDAPVVSHVHELRAGLAAVNVLRAGKRPAHYIAVSNHVRDILLTDYPIAARPVVTFDAGGATQVLAEGRGVLVGPFDTESMAAAVTHLLCHPGARAEVGARLAAHVHALHDVQRGASDILAAIQRVLPA